MSERFFEVAVNSPLHRTFTYTFASKKQESPIHRLAKVQLNKRVTEGVVLREVSDPKGSFQVKKILELDQDSFAIPEPYVDWATWVSDYYVHPLGQTLRLLFPPLKKLGRKSRKSSPIPAVEKKETLQLTHDQERALKEILKYSGFKTHLLWGVTGSGKTELYMGVLKSILKNNKAALILVPEISLTPQLLRRFAERFGDQISVIHSGLTDREKTDQWWSMVNGEKKILIGARSALFCPIPNLGVIIIDEEHESSFKQEEKLKYHARDCAIVLGQRLDIPVLLGSATPSLESWKNSIDKKFNLITLEKRYSGATLPAIQIVDMRKKNKGTGVALPFWLSEKLYEKITARLESHEQTALFLNRRGLSQAVMCRECGYVSLCPNCDVSLSLHAKTHLVCHYCSYHTDLLSTCSSCHQGEPSPIGIGTEQVEQDIQKLFPLARVLRIDRDEIVSREDLEAAISKIEEHQIDILIGTQMIAKGLDFKNLTLVGVLLADIGFNFPDFRSSEKNFQLLSQVSGRAGRHSQNGEVLIQTYNPDYSSLSFTKENDFIGFSKEELLHRESLFYPPYSHLSRIKIQGNNLTQLRTLCLKIEALSQHVQKSNPSLVFLGPAEAIVFRVKNKYRFHMLIKSSAAKGASSFYKYLLDKLDIPRGIQISLDIDALNTF